MKKWLIPTFIALIAVIGVSGFVYAKSLEVPTQQVTQSVQKPATVEELLNSINAERAKVGVAPLTLDERLNTSAQRKADEMVADNNKTHIDKKGVHGYEYINDTTAKCYADSENITWTADNSKATTEKSVSAWMNSKAHHDALLDPKYTTTGFGINGWAVVEHFCQTA